MVHHPRFCATQCQTSLKGVLLLLTLFWLFSACRPTLNNPLDPKSESFLETGLWRLFLASQCDPNLRGQIELGTGTQALLPLAMKILRSGNIAFSAISAEPLFWNGTSNGVTTNHVGSGTPMAVVFVVSSDFSRILWLDYFGTMVFTVPDSPPSQYFSIEEYSNGDLAVFTLVDGADRPNAINGKPTAAVASFYAARLQQTSGSAIWQTYLNKDNDFLTLESFGMVLDNLEQMLIFYTANSASSLPINPDTLGLDYPGLGTPSVSSNATSPNQKQLGLAVLSNTGIGLRQNFLPSPSNTNTQQAAFINGELVLFGVSQDIFTGTSATHPFPTSDKIFLARVNSNLVISAVAHLGSNDNLTWRAGTFRNFPTGIFLSGATFGSLGGPPPSFPFQSTNRNYFFSRANFDTLSFPWTQYLGNTAAGVIELLIPDLFYSSARQEAFTYRFLNNPSQTFTGPATGVATGTPTLGIPTAKVFFRPDTGDFSSIRYFDTASDGAGNGVDIIASQEEACGGRFVTYSSTPPYAGTLVNRRLVIYTRPGSEEL